MTEAISKLDTVIRFLNDRADRIAATVDPYTDEIVEEVEALEVVIDRLTKERDSQ